MKTLLTNIIFFLFFFIVYSTDPLNNQIQGGGLEPGVEYYLSYGKTNITIGCLGPQPFAPYIGALSATTPPVIPVTLHPVVTTTDAPVQYNIRFEGIPLCSFFSYAIWKVENVSTPIVQNLFITGGGEMGNNGDSLFTIVKDRSDSNAYNIFHCGSAKNQEGCPFVVLWDNNVRGGVVPFILFPFDWKNPLPIYFTKKSNVMSE